jgi:uncharacterized protein YjdB
MTITKTLRAALFLLLAAIVAAPAAFAASDVLTVGTVTASGNTVDVPVYVRDVSGTPLGVDQPAGSKIQSFSVKVTYAPASAVSSVTFTRAGITASLTPTFESSPGTAGTISWLATFPESGATVPFTLNKAAPGDQVAHMIFTLSGSQTPGTAISLTLDSATTQLTNQGGTTKETTTNGGLTLVDGAINIPALTLSITPTSQSVAPGAKVFYTVNTSAPVGSATTVSLSSSNTSIATVPASVTINTGASSANFSVTGVALGHATITGQLPNGGASATASVNVSTPTTTCTTPFVPVPSVAANAASGAPYTVTWLPVTAATEYFVEESTAADFSGATGTTATDTQASFAHTVSANTTYYYRVTARNRSTGCDVSSAASTAVSIVVNAPPPGVQLTRYLAVVGSTPGSLGSFFKTSVQLYNPKPSTISGKLVYHPLGTSGSASDPSLTYSLAPGKTIAYADLLPAMGLGSGLGTVDIVTDVNSSLPVALVRVFNDAGANGTTGLTEDALKAEDALGQGDVGVLQAPVDISKFRLNIGVRSLEQGASMSVTVRDKDGVVVKSVDKTYGPTFFAQVGSAPFLDGYALTGGETITISMTSGRAIVYGATTDNITQDPSAQFAKRVE